MLTSMESFIRLRKAFLCSLCLVRLDDELESRAWHHFWTVFYYSQPGMPANERQHPHFPFVMLGVKEKEVCVRARQGLGAAGSSEEVPLYLGQISNPAIQITPKFQWLLKTDLFLGHPTCALINPSSLESVVPSKVRWSW